MTGRGLRGRRAGRAIIVATVLVLLVFALLLVAQPQTIGVMRRSSVLADVVSFLVIGGGLGGILFGLAWMIRINHADPEAHRSFFRSRRF